MLSHQLGQFVLMKLLLDELDTAISVVAKTESGRVMSRSVAEICPSKHGLEGHTMMQAKRLRVSNASGGSGTAKLKELCRLLDAFGMSRSRVQKQLHFGMVGSVMQRIYYGQSDAEMKLGMSQFKVPSCRQQFMAITPRRFGKTTAVAMFVSAFALAVPGTTTAIFSTGRRASNLLLQQIKNMLLCIPNVEQKIVSSNVETIVLQDGPFQSKISSFPGKART